MLGKLADPGIDPAGGGILTLGHLEAERAQCGRHRVGGFAAAGDAGQRSIRGVADDQRGGRRFAPRDGGRQKASGDGERGNDEGASRHGPSILGTRRFSVCVGEWPVTR